MLHFESIKEGDFREYWKYSIESWTRDMKNAGLLNENTTDEEAEEQVRKFLPNGLNTPNHYIMDIVQDGIVVGRIWYEIREKVTREAYLWDIIIFEDKRGNGYGKEALEFLEEKVKEEGAKRVQLNVFGFNKIAKNLYLKMGYHDAAITMMKYL